MDCKMDYEKLKELHRGSHLQVVVDTNNPIEMTVKTKEDELNVWIFLEIVIYSCAVEGAIEFDFQVEIDRLLGGIQDIENLVLYVEDNTDGAFLESKKKIIFRNVDPKIRIIRYIEDVFEVVLFFPPGGDLQLNQDNFYGDDSVIIQQEKEDRTTHFVGDITYLQYCIGTMTMLTHLIVRRQSHEPCAITHFVVPTGLIYLDVKFQDGTADENPFINVAGATRLSTCFVENVRLLGLNPKKTEYLVVGGLCGHHQETDRVCVDFSFDNETYQKISACERCHHDLENIKIMQELIEYQNEKKFSNVGRLRIHWPSLSLTNLVLDSITLDNLCLLAKVGNILIIARSVFSAQIYSSVKFKVDIFKYTDQICSLVDMHNLGSCVDPGYPHLHYMKIDKI